MGPNLNDKEVQAATVKIQSAFKGFNVRKEKKEGKGCCRADTEKLSGLPASKTNWFLGHCRCHTCCHSHPKSLQRLPSSKKVPSCVQASNRGGSRLCWFRLTQSQRCGCSGSYGKNTDSVSWFCYKETIETGERGLARLERC